MLLRSDVLPPQSAFVLRASAYFYHIRSLRERGHRLPYCCRLLLSLSVLSPSAVAAPLLLPSLSAVRRARAASISKKYEKSDSGLNE
ncbi:hypothetical protein [Methanimicrococcus hacksteinii]|uniref:hypothetical protein n=1 Tax=Methanimicrococcus hacksteinii TaxID=3028293 RepID=UPI00298F3DE6|nr:hypothetical protein [Methanimicrococcus sp. At1]